MKCKVDNCEEPARQIGLCNKHYGRKWRLENRDRIKAREERNRAWDFEAKRDRATKTELNQLVERMSNEMTILQQYIRKVETRVNNLVATVAITRGPTNTSIPRIELPLKEGEDHIDILRLPARAHNCLLDAGITSVQKLIACKPYDLLRIPKMGKVSVLDIEACLEKYKLELGV